MSETFTREEVLGILDLLYEDLQQRMERKQYCKVRGEGTPYQDTSYYFYTFIEGDKLESVFRSFQYKVRNEL